ncbi:MAG: pilus assembly protein [Burkholderiaceae bacterium]
MKKSRSDRFPLRRLLGVCALLLAQGAAAFTISNNPPFLPTPLSPNIAVTLDDSGSMAWAYVPDTLWSFAGTRRFKSAAFNPLYYNPDTVYPPPVDASGNPLATSFTNAWINGFADGVAGRPNNGAVNLSIAYRPTLTYNPNSTSQTFAAHANVAADLAALQAGRVAAGGTLVNPFTTSTPGPAYYYRFDAANVGCDGTTSDEDCYTLVIVSATSGTNPAIGPDERQNFANWYSYYRTRNLLTVSAATRAMAGLPPGARIAWQAINSCNSYGTSCSGWTRSGVGFTAVPNRIRRWIGTPTDAADDTHRRNFYSWVMRLPASGATPLRTAASRAGQYFSTTGDNSPYGIDPNQSPSVTGTQYSCRPNFHILMTDGIWNSDADSGTYCSGATCGNKDGTSRTLPDGTAYDTTSALTRIFRDANSNSVADIAFHYWATDLRPDLTNNQIPYYVDRTGTAVQQYWNPKNDPATWQHLVTFTVGLGLARTMNITTPVDLRWSGSTYAGAGYANLLSGAGTWPATGSNVSPGNVYDLWHAAINSRGQSFAAESPRDLDIALQGALNRILERESAAAALATNSTRLTTDTLLFQARFNSGDWTGRLTAYRINVDGTLGSPVWEATDPGKIPAPGLRNVYSWSGSAGMGFSESDLTAAGLWPSIGSADMLAYLRGDDSREQKNGGPWRNRSTRLGDIVNSDPVFVGAENFGYAGLPEGLATGSTPYRNFLESKKARRKMLYVGANDGMLRAFDALTGEERFAYVPNAVIPSLSLLADPAYAHRYFVDGSPSAWDAFVGGAWKTVLIGTTGAGAKSIFALDVTNPDAFDASKVLWEINANTAARPGDAVDPTYAADLGFTMGQGVVVKLNNGEWGVVFGNGYRSAGERGVLYIVRVADGTLIRKIDTGVGSASTPNGLGTPTLYDANGDDVYDYAYATDMRGNVWKFDLSNANPSLWGIAFAAATGFPNGAPLFQARNASGQVQPIQPRVELARPPLGVPGVIVLFGTGRFFTTTDNIDTTAQSFYGILDNGTPVTTTDRSQLQQQTISLVDVNFRGVTTPLRDVSTNTVDWLTRRGWYIDLPTSKERVIGSAVVRAGRVIFTTLIPSDDPCNFGGSGWLMEVDAKTGAKLPYSVFDTNGDGLVNDSDTSVAGVPLGVGIVKQPLVLEGSPTAQKVMSGTSGHIQIERNRTFNRLGRDSWRELTR